MEEEAELKLHPAWRHALQTLLDEGLQYGRMIDKAYLASLFGLKQPVTARDQQQYDIEFMSMMSCLRAELLERHQIDLHTLWGRGQVVVTNPGEQTGLAVREGTADMQRAIVKMTRRLTFIRHEELTDEQSKQNADALAKAATLAGMVNQRRLRAP